MTPPITRLTIFVDGPDGAGKSTFIPHLRRAMLHAPQVWERWVGSDAVYQRLRLRIPALAVPPFSADEAGGRTWRFRQAFDKIWQVILLPSEETLRERTRKDPPEFDVGWQRATYGAWAEACAALDPREVVTLLVRADHVPADALADIVATLIAETRVEPVYGQGRVTADEARITFGDFYDLVRANHAHTLVQIDYQPIPGRTGHVTLNVAGVPAAPERQGEPA